MGNQSTLRILKSLNARDVYIRAASFTQATLVQFIGRQELDHLEMTEDPPILKQVVAQTWPQFGHTASVGNCQNLSCALQHFFTHPTNCQMKSYLKSSQKHHFICLSSYSHHITLVSVPISADPSSLEPVSMMVLSYSRFPSVLNE